MKKEEKVGKTSPDRTGSVSRKYEIKGSREYGLGGGSRCNRRSEGPGGKESPTPEAGSRGCLRRSLETVPLCSMGRVKSPLVRETAETDTRPQEERDGIGTNSER